ncbi:hypothetical protein, partial [Alicyclobacillus sendaiensis]|uniref:hypothetical protein n=1 Tax=Alicyclobacillus sendaiensis TaxID=192387 RepID=UPI0026F466FA
MNAARGYRLAQAYVYWPALQWGRRRSRRINLPPIREVRGYSMLQWGRRRSRRINVLAYID